MSVFSKTEECAACKVQAEHIVYLRGQIERMSVQIAEERSEYKRTVDALLLTLKGPAIGQGYVEHTASTMPDLTKMLGYMDEEVPEKK